MKANEVEKYLKTNFTGVKYRSGHYQIGAAITKLLSENGFDGSKIYAKGSKYSPSRLNICIINPADNDAASFLTIETKKTKSERYYTYGRSWYDWEYKDFLVTCGSYETIEDSYKACVASVQKGVDSTNKKKVKALKIFEYLKSIGCDKWEAIDLVSRANGLRYANEVDDLFEEEK